ncbi:EamA family transporter [Candidatus Uhrbacteria bacterium]|nr:EamA family transporter [Candidatus Uhrbacteria bacterium]
MWIFVAFLNPLLHAGANILDSYLVHRVFPVKVTLIFYSVLLNLLFLPPIFFFFGLPKLPDARTFFLLFALALISVGYLYPYYKALERNDTSVIVSLFALGKVFVPILAFFLVHEVLAPVQYLGVAIVVLSGVFVNFERTAGRKLNSSLWWMIGCTMILAIEAVLYKYAFLSVDWITGFTWPVALAFLSVLPTLIVPRFRRDIFNGARTFVHNAPLFAAEEFLTFAGMGAGTYAISVASVTVVQTVMSVQPIFVLVYASVFHKLFPGVFKEQLDRGSVKKKILFFILMILGVALTLAPAR